jgi:hypothetical protein
MWTSGVGDRRNPGRVVCYRFVGSDATLTPDAVSLDIGLSPVPLYARADGVGRVWVTARRSDGKLTSRRT